jgi:murein DD-endopeptidase MepM/ murein hydrolase activator NlpD
MLATAMINRAHNSYVSYVSCISHRNIKPIIIFLIGCAAYSTFITHAPAQPVANTPSVQSNHPQSIAMAMLNTLPPKPTVLGSVKEINNSNISSDYGSRIGPFTGLHENHNGLDIPAELGSPILAAGKGTVLYAAHAPGYGNLVEIDHGQGIITRYGHAQKLLVKAGEIIQQSQQIGTVGSTGKSTGPHLHFEISKGGISIDPKILFAIEGKPNSGDMKRYTFIFKDIQLKAPNQLRNTEINKPQVVYTSLATRKSGEPIITIRVPAGKIQQ